LGENLIDRIDPEVPPLPKDHTMMDKVDALWKANKQHERMRMFTDTAYYCVIVFQSREQVVEFVSKMGWVDELGNTHWLDGRVIAKKQGIKLPYVDEALLHEAYNRRRQKSQWPEKLKWFDETSGEFEIIDTPPKK